MYLSIPVNCALVIFTLDAFDNSIEQFVAMYGEKHVSSKSLTLYKLVLFVFLLAVLHLAVTFITAAIPKMPEVKVNQVIPDGV